MTVETQRQKERGMLLGTISLMVYLVVFLLPAKYLGIADFSYLPWLLAFGATLTVQGTLWWLLRNRQGFLERYDPWFLHFPVLAASLLLNLYLYVAPGTQFLLILAWINVLLFGAGKAGFRAVMLWSAIHFALFALVLFSVRERIEDFSLPREVMQLWMLFGVCLAMAVIYQRLLRRTWRAHEIQKQSEKTLRDSEARLRQVIDLVPHFIFAKDQTGRFILANRAVADAYGTTPEVLLTRTDADFASSPDEVEQFRRDDLEVIEGGAPKVIPEERLTDAAGNVRVLQTTKIPFTFANSDLPALLGVAIDITEILAAQEQKRELERQVQHLQKLESLGILAGGVAHDFNNILVSVLGHADLARRDLPEGSQAGRNVRRIEAAAERAAELVDQLLAYSGHGQFVVETLDLSQLVEGVADLIHASISKKAEVALDRTHGSVYVKADRAQLHQVLMSLMTNASDALEGQTGTITVTTGLVQVDRGDLDAALNGEELKAGEVAFIEVADTGQGMDAETKSKIFDPFFTTKFVGRGLGLAAVLGIVRGHGGAITVDSEPGRGTKIRLLMPATEAPATIEPPVARQVTPSDELPRGPILVVDDDPAVREFVKEALERSGGEVLLAVHGAEGVDTFSQRNRDISVVLLDMTMPVMDGAEAFRELQRIRKDVPVILMSGFSEQLATDGFEQPPAGFLHKPYTAEQLTGKIQQVVADQRS